MGPSGVQASILEEEMTYTGAELAPHFILRKTSLRGSALISFKGSCLVETESLVDWEDRLVSDHIRAKKMLHFLGEFFGLTLREGVLLQRRLVTMIKECIESQLKNGERLFQKGDDLYSIDDRKLNVSIVAPSGVSQLLHIGINIDPEGAPVPAIGLDQLGVDPDLLATQLTEKFLQEWKSVEWACTKVRVIHSS